MVTVNPAMIMATAAAAVSSPDVPVRGRIRGTVEACLVIDAAVSELSVFATGILFVVGASAFPGVRTSSDTSEESG